MVTYRITVKTEPGLHEPLRHYAEVYKVTPNGAELIRNVSTGSARTGPREGPGAECTVIYLAKEMAEDDYKGVLDLTFT